MDQIDVPKKCLQTCFGGPNYVVLLEARRNFGPSQNFRQTGALNFDDTDVQILLV